MNYSNKVGAPIFVVGRNRSGTTLMVNVLGKHSMLYSPESETGFFSYLWRIRKIFPDISDEKDLIDLIYFIANMLHIGFIRAEKTESKILTDRDIWRIIKDIGVFRTYEDVFFTVMSYFTKRNGKLRWVEKTPAHIFSVNQILSEFPDAVFVELVRDPRDVMSSIKIMEKKGMWGGRIRYNPFFATLSFKLFNLAGVSAKKKYPSKIIRIRYEDLIEKPEQTIREVCGFLGQTFESAMLNISHYIPSEISREKRSVFSKEPIGRYKSTLTPDEIALCQIFNRKEMITLNYNMIRIGWWHKLKIINLIIKSILDAVIRFFFDLKERRSLLLKTFLMRLGYLKSAKRLIQKFPNND